MARVAIVGSRNISVKVEQQVREYVKTLPLDTVVVSGSARGVDSVAVDEAKLCGLKYQEFVPDYVNYGRAAPLFRNDLIVENCDELTAFWDGMSRGTNYTIGRARRRNLPVTVFSIPVFQGEEDALQASDPGSSPGTGTNFRAVNKGEMVKPLEGTNEASPPAKG